MRKPSIPIPEKGVGIEGFFYWSNILGGVMEELKQLGKFLVEHWFSVSVLVLLVYLIVTGQIKKVINAKKVKAGVQGIEIENNDLSLPKQDSGCCPSPKCNESIWNALRKLFARTEDIQKTHEKRQRETLEYRAKILNTVSVLEMRLEEVARTMVIIQENVQDNSVSILKSNFYNDCLPDAERMMDGLRYLYKGRNGEVKQDVIKFVLDGREDMYFTGIKAAPKLRIADVDAAIAAKKRKGEEL
jgi:hypothetical protein